MKDIHLAYLAGIVDGEGSIELKWQKNKMSMDLLLHVFNSDRPLFDWIEGHFGGKTYEIHRRVRLLKPQWAQVFNWNLRGQNARDLLEQLVPHMVVKKAQAELAIDFWQHRKPMPYGRGIPGQPGIRGRMRPSDETIALRASYKERMHQLNLKNRPGPPD